MDRDARVDRGERGLSALAGFGERRETGGTRTNLVCDLRWRVLSECPGLRDRRWRFRGGRSALPHPVRLEGLPDSSARRTPCFQDHGRPRPGLRTNRAGLEHSGHPLHPRRKGRDERGALAQCPDPRRARTSRGVRLRRDRARSEHESVPRKTGDRSRRVSARAPSRRKQTSGSLHRRRCCGSCL